VLVLTMYDDDESVFAALRAGARGYLLKGARRSELRAAVVAVAERHATFGPGIADRILERTLDAPAHANRFPSLTPRESDVLNALSDGHQPAEIARRLHISDKTVRNNIATILTKLHVTTRAAAIQLARDGRGDTSGPPRGPA
jgi:DNA-binding NarL/FixJ family response regulator